MPQVSANPVRSAAWIMARVRATGRRDLISTIDHEYRKGEDLCGPVGSKLSPQQERIARAYVNGRRTQGQIATDLKITGACVNVQLKRIRHKLSAATDQELTEAFRRGYGFGVDQGAPVDGELSPREIAVLREQYEGYTRSRDRAAPRDQGGRGRAGARPCAVQVGRHHDDRGSEQGSGARSTASGQRGCSMSSNKITVRKDRAAGLWMVNCPCHDLPLHNRFWDFWWLAILNATTHADRDHGAT
jgi:DNA-binding CsgD family transcriptional regulator